MLRRIGFSIASNQRRHYVRRLSTIQDDGRTTPITQSKQQYAIPTYDALFKYVLGEPSLHSSFFHALAGLDIETAQRIDEHMNPIQELQNLRTLINDVETIKAFSSLRNKDRISVSYQREKKRACSSGIYEFCQSFTASLRRSGSCISKTTF